MSPHPSRFLSVSLFHILSAPPGADQRWLYENVLRSGGGVRGEIKDGPMRNGTEADGTPSERHRRGDSEKRLMKYRTATNSLLGKHNVESNQADWQFGSSRFSRLCLWQLLPSQSASQMTSVSAAKTVPMATTFSLCNLIRRRGEGRQTPEN